MKQITDAVDGSRIVLHEGDRVTDGRATATVADTAPGEIKLKYSDGDTMWIQDNCFTDDGGLKTV